MKKDKAIKYFKLAQTLADLFSKDPSSKVGTIILAPGSLQILSLGYNGMPRKIDEHISKRWERPNKYKYVEHAERNAIYNASRHGVPLKGSIAITTKYPCCDCARAFIQTGIYMIVSKHPDFNHPTWGEDFVISNEMFEEAGIKQIYLEERDLGPFQNLSFKSKDPKSLDFLNSSENKFVIDEFLF